MFKRLLRKKSYKKIVAMMTAALFSMSLITVEVNAKTNGVIENNSFDNWLNGWNTKGDVGAVSVNSGWGQDGGNSLNYWSDSDYEVWTEQTITGLENGYYRVEAYAASGGGQDSIYLYANDFGGTGARTSAPISDNFMKVVLNFEVTNGQATIGFYSKGKAGNWANFDNISITKVNEGFTFLKGGDLTMANLMEDQGAVFYDENGNERDVFHILAENGFNIVRLRTHNDTGRDTGVDEYYLPDGYQDTEDMLSLAKRAKEMGMAIQLTLNYSDWWPNAETQDIPSSWKKEIEGLSEEAAVDKLEELVYDYTKDIMQRMADQGTIPEYISLGNEMHTGILFPYGKVGNLENFKRFINAGYDAVKSVSTETQVVLHLDMAGDTAKYTTFFDMCENNGIKYDVIGPSYYPFWTKKNVEDIVPWFNWLGERYQKKILIMETGYNWNPTKPDGWPGQLSDNGNESHESSPQGQKEFLDELFNGIRNVENNWVVGDLYWDPIMIDNEGVGWAMERGEAEDGSEDKAGSNVVSNTTLFDFDGHALPSLKAFRDNTEGSAEGMISLVVKGQGGNTISNATVELEIGGKKYTKTTDKYGRIFMVGLSPVEGTVTVSKVGYSNGVESFKITASQTTTVEVNLGSGSASGLVTDEAGNPIENASVYSVIDGVKFTAKSNTDGSYVLADLPQGKEYTLFAEKIGYEATSISGVEIETGKTTENINLSLKLNSGTIAGVVTDNNGKLINNANVTVKSKEGKTYNTTTNEDGSYAVNYILADSDYSVTVFKNGYIESSVTGVAVECGKTTENVNIEITANFGAITGTAVDSNNKPVQGVKITISRKYEKLFEITTNEDGTFVIPEVLDNKDYEIVASKDGYGTINLSNITVKPGNATELVLRMATPIELVNPSFENENDEGSLDGWNIEESVANSVKTDYRGHLDEKYKSPAGNWSLNMWADKEYTVKMSQEVTGLVPGKYELRAMVYQGEYGGHSKMFINDSEVNLEKSDGWVQYTIPVWITKGSATIGFDYTAIGGDWANIDAVELNFISPLNYDELEKAISEVELLETTNFIPNSVKALEEVLVSAKAILVSQEATQDKVDEVLAKLRAAVEALAEKADKTKLIEKVNKAEQIDMSKYTEGSVEVLLNAINEAKNVIEDENVTKVEVNKMIDTLEEAIKGLVLISDDNNNNNGGQGGNGGNNNGSGSQGGNGNNSGSVDVDDSGNKDNNTNNSQNTEANLPQTGGVNSTFILLGGSALILAGATSIRKRKIK